MASPGASSSHYVFGPFRLDESARRLEKGGLPVAITPKAFDLLLLLVSREGQVVSKDEVIARLWPDAHVEEGNVKVTVSMIRRVLGDGVDGVQYIETVPKLGYRFAAPVHREDKGQPGNRPVRVVAPAPAARRSRALWAALLLSLTIVVGAMGFALTVRREPPIESIAVLPFVGTTGDSTLGYLADGLTESVIRELSASPSLRVISTGPPATYRGGTPDPRDIGRDLKATVIFRARVSSAGTRVVIDAEVVNAIDGRQVWSEQFTRPLDVMPAAESEVSRMVAQHLRDALAQPQPPTDHARPSTSNVEAFQHYVEGRAAVDRRTRDDLQKALEHFQLAIDEDPKYALAYVGLAETYGNLGVRGYIPPIEGRRKLEALAARAIALDPDLAEAHMALGFAATSFAPYNFETGDRELRRSLELSPSLALGHFYLGLSFNRQGRVDAGLPEILKARELDPLSAVIARQVAMSYYLKRDYAAARSLLHEADALGPAFSMTFEVGIYVKTGEYAEALAKLEAEGKDRKNDPVLILSKGLIQAAMGQTSAAHHAITSLEHLAGSVDDQAHWIAKIYAVLGEKAQAFEWLDRALATGALGSYYRDDPVWDGIRADPRFAAVAVRAGVQ